MPCTPVAIGFFSNWWVPCSVLTPYIALYITYLSSLNLRYSHEPRRGVVTLYYYYPYSIMQN